MRCPTCAHVAALLASLLLTACATPPDLQQTLRQNGTASPQLQRGPRMLSPAQSTAILERLRQEQRNDILDRHLAFESALLDKPIVTGNRLKLLQDGPATYQAMFTAIEAAREHINLETYIFDDDEIGRQFAELLRKKQRQGVQINLIYDSAGSLETPSVFFEQLRAAGMRVLEFNPLNPLQARGKWLLNNRDHRKLLVVDGRIAFVGGINISKVYSRGSRPFKHHGTDGGKSPPWRDTHMQIEGPVVRDFQQSFLDTWQAQSGQPLAGGGYFPTLAKRGEELVRAIASRYDDPYSQVYLSLISAISHAEKQVYLTYAYFVPDPQLLQVLCAAARRGVDVRLILPGTTDTWMTLNAGRAHYQALLDAGVKLYERQDALLHAKTAVVDGVWSSLGSTNLDWRSFLHNNELNAEVLSRDFAAQMLLMFEQDQTAAQSITAEAWRHRPLSQRIKEWGASIWAYWL
ncbi:cardiolipin synthase [Chitinimonas sp.]|uniref:cardiolipin synthase n=1 Tax=Chitinimonas sp. TaxID=1934313 RepID=UPI002F947A47